jgi:hypothetical protein
MRRGSIGRWILFAMLVVITLMATTVIPWSSGWHAQVSAHHLEQIWTEYSHIIDRIIPSFRNNDSCGNCLSEIPAHVFVDREVIT